MNLILKVGSIYTHGGMDAMVHRPTIGRHISTEKSFSRLLIAIDQQSRLQLAIGFANQLQLAIDLHVDY